jgi:UTP--glucose-1-phosphate uridylyltransferase
MASIRSVIIPAAGWGTRLLPASQSVPKELLPVYDKPAIEWVVEEVIAAGIERVIFIGARGKSSILDHFDRHPRLESILNKSGKETLAQRIKSRAESAEFIEIRQGEAMGLGHAILRGESCIQEDYFAIVLPDDLYLGKPPALRELIDLHEREGGSVLGLQTVDRSQSHLYGMISGNPVSDRHWRLKSMVEKPSPEDSPSRQAITGRYLVPRSIFDILRTQNRGALGEIQLTDALNKLAHESLFHGIIPQAPRFDTGSATGLLIAGLSQGLLGEDAEMIRQAIAKLNTRS